MSYSKRHLTAKFQLGQGSFGEGGFNTVEVAGLRASATITKTGGAGMNLLNLRIDGLTPTVANSLSTLGKPIQTGGRQNLISLSAGSDDTGMAVCFIGTIWTAFQNFQNAPEASLDITANAGMFDAMRPLPPSSFAGTADVATIMSGIASQMGYAFENNGVQVKLSNQYAAGTGKTQIEKLAKAADIDWIIDDHSTGGTAGATPPPTAPATPNPPPVPTLAIWPKTGTRGGSVPLISAETGMVGYPTWTDAALQIKTLYNPTIAFGALVKVQSVIKNTCGQWQVFNLTHDLESETVGGKWFTTLDCSVIGHPIVTG